MCKRTSEKTVEPSPSLSYAKLYTTTWMPYDEISLQVKGFTLDAEWQGFLEQIALQD
ncbi:MAG: hypothetical protein GX111_02040 [Clostridiales bacterium]|nr:hypothetical protein [Clostridiales bacterium]